MKKQLLIMFVSILLLTGCQTDTVEDDKSKPKEEVSNNTNTEEKK